MLDIRRANRWRFPSVKYTNMRKAYPSLADGIFKQWFSITRHWRGRIVDVSFRHHVFIFDFRKSWVDDMAFPEATKKDREAVDNAIKATKGNQ